MGSGGVDFLFYITLYKGRVQLNFILFYQEHLLKEYGLRKQHSLSLIHFEV